MSNLNYGGKQPNSSSFIDIFYDNNINDKASIVSVKTFNPTITNKNGIKVFFDQSNVNNLNSNSNSNSKIIKL